MSGWKPSDPEISWFWRALRSFSQEERSRFLMFVTSSSRVPLGGFTQLQGSSGTQPFQIQKVSRVTHSLTLSLLQSNLCSDIHWTLADTCSSFRRLRRQRPIAVHQRTRQSTPSQYMLQSSPLTLLCFLRTTSGKTSFRRDGDLRIREGVTLAWRECPREWLLLTCVIHSFVHQVVALARRICTRVHVYKY